MKISIVVPVYNSAGYLPGCLEGLHALDYPREDYEILMVDNNSTDESPRILASDNRIRLLKETKQGSYAARNRAVREAKGEILAFLDSDCVPDPAWLLRIEEAFEDPQAQILMGHRKPGSNRLRMSLLSGYEAKKNELVFNSKTPELYYGFTNNMAVRKSTFDRYGPFVERPRGSDTIFVRRAVNGEGCDAVRYAKDMIVEHAEMAGVRTYYRKMFTYGRSRGLYQHILKTTPLSGSQRLSAMRISIRERRYALPKTALLALLLAGGMVAWNMGSYSALLWKPRSE